MNPMVAIDKPLCLSVSPETEEPHVCQTSDKSDICRVR
jgi:hypothetical protein